MDTVKKLEQTFKQWHKESPVHIPDSAKKWLAVNSWWLVAVGVVISILSLLGTLRTLLWSESMIRQAQNIANTFGVAIPDHTANVVGLWISVATMIVVVLISLKAIQPLKKLQKSGWDLLFLSFLVAIVGTTVSGLVDGSIVPTLIGLVIGVFLGGFMLFEIRDQFVKAKTAKSTDKDTATES